MTGERGYVGIGINGKRTYSFRVRVRTARVFGADFVFSVGKRNPRETSSVVELAEGAMVPSTSRWGPRWSSTIGGSSGRRSGPAWC